MLLYLDEIDALILALWLMQSSLGNKSSFSKGKIKRILADLDEGLKDYEKAKD